MLSLSAIIVFFSALNIIIVAFGENKNLQIIPDDYDKFEPPWQRGNPADVYVQLSVLDVDQIDDGRMQFSLQCYVSEYWKDRRLNLSSFMEENDIDPIFPSYLERGIWLPDVIFENAREGKLFQLSLPNTAIKVKKDGTLVRSSRYGLLIGCLMDFHIFPMDTQECFLKVSTLSNPNNKVLLHWAAEHPRRKQESILMMYDIQPLKYELRQPETDTSTEYWPSGNYTYLYANFTFRRRLSGSLFNIYVPSTLVVFLSWISMWIEVEAVPARVTLGVTSLLTLATQVVQAHAGLPSISYMTAVDIWLFACLITVFSSLLEFAFAYQIFILNKQRKAKNVSEGRSVHVRKIDKILTSNLCQDISSRRPWCTASVGEVNSENGEKSLDKLCRKLFPFLFGVFSISYWSYFLSKTV